MDISEMFHNDKINITNENVKVNIFFYDEKGPLLGMNIDQSAIHSETQFITVCYDDENSLVFVPKRDIMRIEMYNAFD